MVTREGIGLVGITATVVIIWCIFRDQRRRREAATDEPSSNNQQSSNQQSSNQQRMATSTPSDRLDDFALAEIRRASLLHFFVDKGAHMTIQPSDMCNEATSDDADPRISASTTGTAEPPVDTHMSDSSNDHELGSDMLDFDLEAAIAASQSMQDNTRSQCARAVRLRNRFPPQPAIVSTDCTICLEAFEAGQNIIFSTNPNCSHVFHEQCIMEHLMRFEAEENQDSESPKGALCPCCRRVFMEST
mmetsp:Transcript_14170/g.39052  ORF Transcript_14170/g.39052 Transcript_14170/m.39052 type:complete len:246 (-) Transcript_14170:162-899(-)